MCKVAEFDIFEQQFLEIIGEFRTITVSEDRLRQALRNEATRAEAAEKARDAAVHDALEAQNSAAATAAGASTATAALSKANEEITVLKMNSELVERERICQEKRCIKLTEKLATLEREVQQLRPVQSALSTLQLQYTELQERIRCATEEARREVTRLESELRRVEKCASAGVEIRERARLAAAAHAREKRLIADELQHCTRELLAANAEISRLKAVIAEMQQRSSQNSKIKIEDMVNHDKGSLTEIRAVLEAERAGVATLEQALAAALADNAELAAKVNANDNPADSEKALKVSSKNTQDTSTCPIDNFLAE